MTCIEKYLEEHPASNAGMVIFSKCPHHQGIDIAVPEYCTGTVWGGVCAKCWDREVTDTPQEAPKTDENAIRVVLDPGAKMPTRAHKLDAGYDLYSPVDAIVYPRWKGGKENSVVIDTGVHVAIPEGYVGDIEPKSGLMVNHSIITDGTIDAGYTGAIKVKLFNLGNQICIIEKGQKIAQLVLKKIITPELVAVDSLEDTERGNGGFGSTGKF